MLKREELKVGEEYIHPHLGIAIVLSIGDLMAFYRWHTGSEAVRSIKDFLEDFSLVPKPKKQIKLVGYIIHEYFTEYLSHITPEYHWKKVSERIIEIEE